MRMFSQKTEIGQLLASASVAAIVLGSIAAPARAADTPPAQVAAADADAGQLETIVVTARKRSEDLLSIPVSVSALTAKDLEVKGIETLDDVANFTPGMTDDQANGGGARSDRSFQQLIIRGMNPSSTLNPTTSIFINGTPVASADFLQNLDDVEQVEVLKGPQSAYFGRETFAGAVNVRAKSADVEGWGGDVSVNVGSRSTENLSFVVNVPVVTDKLAVRFGYTYDSHDGSYVNAANPSQTLGDQTTKSAHFAITAKPIDNLTIKAFGTVFQDDDGPAATGALIAAPGKSFNQSNCTVAGAAFFCGTLPGLLSQSPAQNTTISPTVNFANLSQAFLNSPGGILGKDDLVDGFGLKRNAFHTDVSVEYAAPSLGLTFTYLGSYNRDVWSEISDLSNLDGAAGGQYPGYAGFPFEVQSAAHDMSQEFRVASDPSLPYRGLLGASYVDAHVQSALGVTQYGPNGVAAGGPTQSATSGVFFSMAYDVIPEVTINFDGRYQADTETAYNATNVQVAKGTTRDFLPRVSGQYKFAPDMMVYFTYSEGVNPGAFNTQISTLPTVSKTELNSLGVAGGLDVMPEDISNYELGFKGKFFDGRATLSADVYYDKWTNQLNLKTYNFPAADPANPYNVLGGAQYVAGNKSIYPYTYTDNSANSTAKGLEVEAHFIPVLHVAVNVAGAINDTQYDSFNCTTCLPYPTNPGFNANGKYLPNSPEYSTTVGVEYSNEVQVFGDAAWFVRGDYVWRDGVYIESSNTVKTPSINLVNFRGGISWDHLSVEGWINNAFNNKAYTSGFQDVNFATDFGPSVVMVGLPQLITGGVRLKFTY